MFKLLKSSKSGKSRAGVLTTDRSVIPTPVFMPVGTRGAVKAVEQKVLNEMGYKIILGNTYHLYLTPGLDVIEKMNGLHQFINWDKSILTDSGGYQVFSLKGLRKTTLNGVEFQSHIDGSRHIFTPENVINTQRLLGSDVVMVFDECLEYPADKKRAIDSASLSIDWARRSKKQFDSTESKYAARQFLFGIGQGGMFADLRKTYLNDLIDIGFDGYALGGLSVGEPADIMYELVDISTDILPVEKPRYLMGVGTPQNILEAIDRGIDMFDCVLPTRNARNGQLFTTRGKINIRNSKYKYSNELIDENIDIFPSKNLSLGYLRHLFMTNEITALIYATQQNLAFYKWLLDKARENILNENYCSWKAEILLTLNSE